MRDDEVRQSFLPLKDIAIEASRALAHLDLDRLEQLILNCGDINRKLAGSKEVLSSLKHQVREATNDMAVLGKLLEVTRASVAVLTCDREPDAQLDYGESPVRRWRSTEAGCGDN